MIEFEKEKNPIEGLEEEIETFTSRFCVDRGSVQIVEEIARHFAKWGAEHRGSSEISKDLEDASLVYGLSVPCEYPPVIDAEGGEHPVFDLTAVEDAFIAGAKWQKEQMMKGAIDAEFCSAGMFMPMIDFKDKRMEGIKYGDTIKVIVIKEK